MTRAAQRADRALRLVEELLSSGQVQRSARRQLLRIRHELIELRNERDVGKRDALVLAERWATVVARLYELFDQWFM